MPKQLSSLLLSLLLLLTVACSKKSTPEPAPTLAGTWTLHHTEEVHFADDGSTLSTTTSPPVDPTSYIFTATDLKIQTGSRTQGPYPYTHEGTIIHCQYTAGSMPTDILIKSLTKSELVLEQTTVRVTGFGSIRATSTFTR